MAQLNYNDFEQRQAQAEQSANRPRISYFGLTNNGDEALVRFMFDKPEDFDIVVVHPYQINGKTRKINCIRDSRDSLEACPLCAADTPVQQRFYIHLVQYTKDENGNVVATPKIWERSTAYINTLRNLCQEYAPLSDNLFKIKRNGAAGSVETTYDILFANPNTYPSSIYVKDPSVFDNISAIGTAVFDYNHDQLESLLNTGSVNNVAKSQPTAEPTPVATTPTYNNSVNQTNPFAADPNEGSMPRPRRYY